MKLGMQVPYAGGFKESAALVQQYEKAGLDIVWVAEAYGFDGVSMMGYLAATTETIQIGSAILPIFTRTPALIAQTAAGLDFVSDGRFILGIGASGPQVIEGFHGVPYQAPLGRTRELIDICRMAWKREKLVYDGKYYTLPLPPEQGTGLGKPLKFITHPVRDSIPIYVASLGPKNVQMTAELADGWLPLFYIPERANDVWGDDMSAGFAKRSADLGPLDIVAGGLVAIGEDAA
jgi:F420-dependent oxidoreductase-like protein